MLVSGSEVIVIAEKPVAGGRMLARHEGLVVLVVGAIPGERVRVRIERVTRQLVYADTIDVLDPDADRRPGAADWACGGLLYSHINYPRQQALKAELIADAFARIGKVTLPTPVDVAPSQERGYRMRARLHARNGRLGFFREGTHDLCDAAMTGQLLPATAEAIERLCSALGTRRLNGVVSCEIAENIPADQRAVVIECNASTATVDGMEEMDEIEGITGLALDVQGNPGPTMVYGSPYVLDALEVPGAPNTVQLRHHVRSFFQGNRWLVAQLVERLAGQVPDDDVMDLYAGVGLFAISLAAAGKTRVVAVEGDLASGLDLDANAAPYRPAVEVKRTAVERYLQQVGGTPFSTAVLDPPRTGLSREAMAGVLNLQVPRVVYVACDVATLARDVRRFLDDHYQLEHVEAFDLFPNTAHVEVLVVLTRT